MGFRTGEAGFAEPKPSPIFLEPCCAAISVRDCPGGLLDSSSARRVYRAHAGIAHRVGSTGRIELVTVVRDCGFRIPGCAIQQGFVRLLQVLIKECKSERLSNA